MQRLVVITFLIFAFFCESIYGLNGKEIYQKVKDSVFMIYALNIQDKKIINASQGSAVAVSPNLLITNCHVTEGKTTLLIKLKKEYIHGLLIYGNQEKDLCIIFVPGAAFHPVNTRSEKTLSVGEDVFAIGSPHGYENSFSKGVISAIRMYKDKKIIQTDANIHFGSSGGGLFDESGNLVGITTGSSKNLAYALPTSWILKVFPSLSKKAHKDIVFHNEEKEVISSKPLPIRIAKYGTNIELYRFGKFCFISLLGKNNKSKFVSRIVWFPFEPRVLYISRRGSPLSYTLNEIVKLGSSEYQTKTNVDSYINLNNRAIPLILIKGSNQEKSVLTAILSYNPSVVFKKGRFFTMYLKSGNKSFQEISFDLLGFTDAYLVYNNLCAN